MYQWCTDWIEWFTDDWAAKHHSWNTMCYKSCCNLLLSKHTHSLCEHTEAGSSLLKFPLSHHTHGFSAIAYVSALLFVFPSQEGRQNLHILNQWQAQTEATYIKQASFMSFLQRESFTRKWTDLHLAFVKIMIKLKRKQVFRLLFLLPLPNHAPFINALF